MADGECCVALCRFCCNQRVVGKNTSLSLAITQNLWTAQNQVRPNGCDSIWTHTECLEVDSSNDLKRQPQNTEGPVSLYYRRAWSEAKTLIINIISSAQHLAAEHGHPRHAEGAVRHLLSADSTAN